MRNLLNPSLRSLVAVTAAAGIALSVAEKPEASSLGADGLGSSIAKADLFVAPAGSDAGSCTRDTPCASFSRAYAVARPGEVVEVAAGSYGRQTLDRDPSKTSWNDVVFRPAAGARVTLAEFVTGSSKSPTGAKHFEVRDMKILSYARVRWGSEDVTLRNLDAAGLNVTSARRVRVLGGDYGPLADGVSHINACGVPGCYPAEDVLIDGAVFHDYTITNPAKHSECLMIWPGRRVTIRNSTFRNCTDFDVLVKPYKTSLVGLPGEITFENNFFDEPIVGDACLCRRGGNAIAITQGGGESWSGVQIRYNSSLGGFRVDPAIRDVDVKGNVGRKDSTFSCQKNVRFSYNVWNGTRCAGTDRRAPLGAVFLDSSSAGFNLHLRPRSRAIGAGDPGNAPRADLRGRIRPQNLAADAGASQRESALAQAGRRIGAVEIGMPPAQVLAWYGQPRKRSTLRGANVEIHSYTVRAGWLRVHYRDGRVVAVSTTSRFYRTRSGVGPGGALPVPASGKRVCVAVGAAGLYVTPRGGKKKVVAELTVAARNYTPTCVSG